MHDVIPEFAWSEAQGKRGHPRKLGRCDHRCMDLRNDLVNQSYEDISEAVRQFSAVRIASLAETLKPFAEAAFDGDPAALSYMEPARISAQTAVVKLYLSSLEKLGGLYRVTHEPVKPEPVEPMVPAAQVPLMIERAVETAVEQAIEQFRLDQEAARVAREQVSADEAKAALSAALVRIKGRS